MTDQARSLRDLPAVDALAGALEPSLTAMERIAIAREAISRARASISGGEDADPARIADLLVAQVILRRPTPVLNATGVLLHTNLGRAPWAEEAARNGGVMAKGYSNTELDRVDGERGSRNHDTYRLLTLLTGAEAALVVNNNAAALMLTLAALSSGRAAPVSRGELIEIGGSYRLPELMTAAGARLIEVGTTNRTRLGDYETALQINDCGIVLKVHPANYEMGGFVEDVPLREIARISHVPVVYDVGSGLIDSSVPWLDDPPQWLANEPGIRQSLESGADLALFSGDKLLGGPQSGIVVGRQSLIERLRRHPLARAVRVDSSTDAALNATLRMYVEGRAAEIPIWAMVTISEEQLAERASAIQATVGGALERGTSLVGAWRAPEARLTTTVLRFPNRQDAFLRLLQAETTPVLARRDAGDLVVDLRTIPPAQDEALSQALTRALDEQRGDAPEGGRNQA